MYIHGWHENQTFYDVYDFNWSVRDQGGTDRSATLLPLAYSSVENSVAPLDLVRGTFPRSPDWSSISCSTRRYNSRIPDGAAYMGWETQSVHGSPGTLNGGEEQWTKGTDYINSWNTGIPIVVPISDRYLFTTTHYIITGDTVGGEIANAYGDWFFMNKSNTMFLVKTKATVDMRRNPHIPPFTELRDHSFGDMSILEIDTIEEVIVNQDGPGYTQTGIFYETMTATGCLPITKFMSQDTVNWDNPQSSFTIWKDKPLWILDRQGRCVILWGLERDNPGGGVIDSARTRTISPYTGKGALAHANYTIIHGGDSGTPQWVNIEGHGFVLSGVNFGAGIPRPEIEEWIRAIFPIDTPDFEYVIPVLGDPPLANTVIPYYEEFSSPLDPSSPKQAGKSVTVSLTTTGGTFVSNIIDLTSDGSAYEYPIIDNAVTEAETFLQLRDNLGRRDLSFNNKIYSDFEPHAIQFDMYFELKPTSGSTFRMWSFDYPDSITAKIILGGEEFDIPDSVLTNQWPSNIQYLLYVRENSSGNRSFKPAIARTMTNEIIRNFHPEDPDFYTPGSRHRLQLKVYNNTEGQENDIRTMEIGTITIGEAPQDFAITWDPTQMWFENTVTFSLETSNNPVPSLSFQEESFFIDIPNFGLFSTLPEWMTYVSHTETNLVVQINSDEIDQTFFEFLVFRGYDEFENLSTLTERLLLSSVPVPDDDDSPAEEG